MSQLESKKEILLNKEDNKNELEILNKKIKNLKLMKILVKGKLLADKKNKENSLNTSENVLIENNENLVMVNNENFINDERENKDIISENISKHKIIFFS